MSTTSDSTSNSTSDLETSSSTTSSKSLKYVVTHVFLPVWLPDHSDYTLEQPMPIAPISTEPLSRLSGNASPICYTTCKPPPSLSVGTGTTSSPSYAECKQEVCLKILCRSVLTVYRYPCVFQPTWKCCDYPHEAGELYIVRIVRGFSQQ